MFLKMHTERQARKLCNVHTAYSQPTFVAFLLTRHGINRVFSVLLSDADNH